MTLLTTRPQKISVGVIGAGAWGTALALVAARAGHDVTLWARGADVAAEINATRQNTRRLPGVPLDVRITATADPADLAACDWWLAAAPAQATRATLALFAAHMRAALPVVITAKGFEQSSGQFLTDVAGEVLPGCEPLVLSGPSFAGDVARGLPTAVTLAARTLDIARPVAEALSLPTFRPYISDDLAGVQVGGAMKNVLAIACGIVTGRGLGESARAALIARAFAELTRFGRAFGGRPETLAGLSGLGDLVLTCSSAQSRNFAYGLALGRGADGGARDERAGVTEGAHTAAAALRIARAKNIDVPIVEAVADILAGTLTIDAAIERLMQRPLRTEG